MEIAAILKYIKEREDKKKRKGRKVLQFHKNLPIPGTENTSFKANLPLDNLCGLGSPSIMNYLHVYVVSPQLDAKQLHRKWGNPFLSTPLSIRANARHSVCIQTQSIWCLHTPKVPSPWCISASIRPSIPKHLHFCTVWPHRSQDFRRLQRQLTEQSEPPRPQPERRTWSWLCPKRWNAEAMHATSGHLPFWSQGVIRPKGRETGRRRRGEKQKGYFTN